MNAHISEFHPTPAHRSKSHRACLARLRESAEPLVAEVLRTAGFCFSVRCSRPTGTPPPPSPWSADTGTGSKDDSREPRRARGSHRRPPARRPGPRSIIPSRHLPNARLNPPPRMVQISNLKSQISKLIIPITKIKTVTQIAPIEPIACEERTTKGESGKMEN